MKKIICSMLLLIGLIFPIAVPASAGAADPAQICSGTAGNTEVCKELKSGGKTNPIIHDIKIALDILSIIAGFASVVLIIIGGIKLTTANGDPASVKSGRDSIIYALIGVVVIIFSQTIVAFVLDKLG